MADKLIINYTKFILDNIPDSPYLIPLFIMKDGKLLEGKQAPFTARLPVYCSKPEIHDRYFTVELKFSSYVKELTMYISRQKSPQDLLHEFDRKVKEEVYRTFLQNDDYHKVEEMNAKAQIAMLDSLNSLKGFNRLKAEKDLSSEERTIFKNQKDD